MTENNIGKYAALQKRNVDYASSHHGRVKGYNDFSVVLNAK